MSMKNLATFYNSNLIDSSENLYLYFSLGESKYAVDIHQVVEIMKLPLLDYPQKLASNVVGLLNYNNFTINVLDLRFYLDIKVTPYSIANQLLVVKTDETIFGLIIDKVEDVIALDKSQIEYFQFSGEQKILEFLYKHHNENISIINLDSVESVIKQGVPSSDIDIPSLFPHDDNSRYKLVQRTQALVEKFQQDLVTNAFSQDKFISFLIDESTYCINLEYVKEFLKNTSITKIPCDLDYIAGIITLRGDFVTVIDLGKFLDLSECKSDACNNSKKNSIIIVDTPDFQIGFLVDEIFSMVEISEDLMTEGSHGRLSKNIMSEVVLEDKLYTILNMKNILSDERFFVEDGI